LYIVRAKSEKQVSITDTGGRNKGVRLGEEINGSK